MTKVDIFSGFLGAGKTTLIKKLISEAYAGQKIVLIENEFGEIGIDGGFMEDAGIQVNELNSGCICCSLVGDFTVALAKVIEEYAPDRILIEPSGVGKLSDIIKAVSAVDGLSIASATVVCDGARCKMYMKNFGEFYNDQVSNASAIVLSRTQNLSEGKLAEAVKLLREKNSEAVLITTPWDKLSGEQILEAIEGCDTLNKQLEEMEHHHHHHHHEHECHDPDCDCHEHHHHHHEHECHDPDCHCHEHHHHHHEHECHDPDCDCHEHHHHHHEHECHDPDCDCHEHHHHHHADEVFASWGMETSAKFSEESIRSILAQLEDSEKYGVILRAKGIVDSTDGQWIHFDYVPGEADIRRGGAGIIGRFCVIGSGINEAGLKQLFGM
ncbi:MAG: GTP-binding protein [Oscillospiraceae bacterium]|nr:GTP-binding protein [Oscillospiraceae bacterium]